MKWRCLAVGLLGLLVGDLSSATARPPAPTRHRTSFVPVPAFFVSATGVDTNAGTLAAPFLTLGRAQTAMRASGTIKTTYIRGGSYTFATVASCDGTNNCGINLQPADNGETWTYYPPDGYNSADFTGGSTTGANGRYYGFFLSGTSNITINGLSIHNFRYAGVGSSGGVSTLTISNNIIFNGFNTAIPNAGGIQCYGCNSTTVTHNVVHDMAAFGIGFGNVNGNISNLTISGNVLYNICTALSDCGAIYSVDAAATATNMAFTNNYVRDGNTFATLTTGAGSAVYMDDCVSNTTVTGNILTGRNGSNTIHVHGGSTNHITGNLTDLATLQQDNFVVQTSDVSGCVNHTMSGNTYQHNIVISGGGGGGYSLLSGTPGNAPAIAHNSYWNYAGAAVGTTGDYSDASPVTQNPQLSGGRAYTVAGGSPVFSSPILFTGLPSSWGPPGYSIPATGTAPSSP